MSVAVTGVLKRQQARRYQLRNVYGLQQLDNEHLPPSRNGTREYRGPLYIAAIYGATDDTAPAHARVCWMFENLLYI
jgi:hypothetical protein